MGIAQIALDPPPPPLSNGHLGALFRTQFFKLFFDIAKMS